MSGLIGSAIYAAGFVLVSAAGMRWSARSNYYCHSEGDHSWGSSGGYCRKWDPATCWRVDESINVRSAAIGSGLGLLWPLALLPLVALFLATRKPISRTPPGLDRRIADLEAELGMARATN